MPEEATQEKTVEEKAALVTEEKKALEDFEWDDGTDNFFGIENTAVKPEVGEVIKEVIKDDDAPVITKKEEEEEEEDETFFGQKKEATPEGTTLKEVEEQEDPDEDSYQSIASKMKEGGIFQNIELPEGEIEEDKFIELQDLEIESRVDEAFEGFFEELDEDGAAFLKHKKEGGSTSDFFKTYGQNTGAPTGDLDDEHYQEKVSRYYYSNIEGEDPEDIDDKIEWLKDSGKLEKYAQKFDQKIKDTDKLQKENLVKATKNASKTAEESKLAFTNSVQETLDKTDQVDNFTFTKERKKSLFPFITKQTVKVGKNKYITGMQSKLGTALRDPEKMLLLAHLLENDFNVEAVINNGNTVRTKKLKDDIQRKKTSVRPSSSGRVTKKRGLADHF